MTYHVVQSGGKFDGSKAANAQLKAEYFTELMSVPMAKQFTWHVKLAINVLADYKVTANPDCKDLDPLTLEALQKIYASGEFSEMAAPALRRSVLYML